MKSSLLFSLPTVAAASSSLPYTSSSSTPCVPDNDEAQNIADFFPVKLDAKDFSADAWTVFYLAKGNSKIVWTRNPDDNTSKNFFVLTQCGTTPPTDSEVATAVDELVANSGWVDITPDLASAISVSVPVTSTMVTSTTTIPYIEMINEGDNILAYAGDPSYVSSGCLRERLPASSTPESASNPFVGTGWGDPNLSATTPAVGPVDISFTGDFYSSSPDPEWGNGVAVKTIEQLENTLKGQGGAVGFYSLFYNKEFTADKLFLGGVELRMDCVESNAVAFAAVNLREEISRQKVLWSNYYVWACDWSVSINEPGNECGGWAIPVCGNYHDFATIMVGADLLCTDEIVAGGKYMKDAEFATWGSAAEIFIYADGTSWDAVFDAKNATLGEFTSVKSKRVYDTSKNGGNDFFESRMANPDSFLEDMTEIVSGGVQHYYTRRFMRNVFDEETGVEEVCAGGVWASLADDCTYISIFFGTGDGGAAARLGGLGMLAAAAAVGFGLLAFA